MKIIRGKIICMNIPQKIKMPQKLLTLLRELKNLLLKSAFGHGSI
jgi:hypothetical protein